MNPRRYIPTAREEMVCYLLSLLDTINDEKTRYRVRLQILRLSGE